MYIPKFIIKLNKELDQDQFIEFFEKNDPHIKNEFPQIEEVNDIKSAIRYVYSHQDEHIGRGLKIINDNIDILRKIAEIISNKLNYSWEGIPTIAINPCSFPICPRFIESSSFMLPYFFDKYSILGVSAHEMTHILYFKKIKDNLPNEVIDTEYPSNEWLLSEIYAPYISNSEEIQKMIEFKDKLYIPDDIKVTDQQLNQIKKLYLENQDLMVFRSKALDVLK